MQPSSPSTSLLGADLDIDIALGNEVDIPYVPLMTTFFTSTTCMETHPTSNKEIVAQDSIPISSSSPLLSSGSTVANQNLPASFTSPTNKDTIVFMKPQLLPVMSEVTAHHASRSSSTNPRPIQEGQPIETLQVDHAIKSEGSARQLQASQSIQSDQSDVPVHPTQSPKLCVSRQNQSSSSDQSQPRKSVQARPAKCVTSHSPKKTQQELASSEMVSQSKPSQLTPGKAPVAQKNSSKKTGVQNSPLPCDVTISDQPAKISVTSTPNASAHAGQIAQGNQSAKLFSSNTSPLTPKPCQLSLQHLPSQSVRPIGTHHAVEHPTRAHMKPAKIVKGPRNSPARSGVRFKKSVPTTRPHLSHPPAQNLEKVIEASTKLLHLYNLQTSELRAARTHISKLQNQLLHLRSENELLRGKPTAQRNITPCTWEKRLSVDGKSEAALLDGCTTPVSEAYVSRSVADDAVTVADECVPDCSDISETKRRRLHGEFDESQQAGVHS